MVTLDIILNRDNVNKLRFDVNGLPAPLDIVTKISLHIPELGVKIDNETSDQYPIKWEHSISQPGIVELKLGSIQDLIDCFILSTTGDVIAGSNIITNIPNEDFFSVDPLSILDNTNFIFGTQVEYVRNNNFSVVLNTASTATETGTTLKFYKPMNGLIFLGKLYIYDATTPNGMWWADFNLRINTGI